MGSLLAKANRRYPEGNKPASLRDLWLQGHLMIKLYDLIPDQIRKFAYEKIKNKINYATDKENLGCRFYILKNGLNNTWEVCLPEQTNSLCEDYKFNNVIITLDYSQLGKFDSKRMKWTDM